MTKPLAIFVLLAALGCGDNAEPEAQLNEAWDLLCEKNEECRSGLPPELATPFAECVENHQACNDQIEPACAGAILELSRCLVELPCGAIFSDDQTCADEGSTFDTACPDDDTPRIFEVDPQC